MAGGKVPLVVRAIIAANKAKMIILDYKLATSINLAGRDVLEAVQTSVYPKVIDCPARGSGKDSLEAVAKNGVQLKVKARVTVRANLSQLVGGRPSRRSSPASVKGSSAQSARRKDMPTCSPILTAFPRRCWPADSIRRPPSRSSRSTSPTSTWGTTSAPACKRIRPKRTCGSRERRRRNAGPAIAREQEMVAQIEESRAKLVDAEAEVPKAISAAIRNGTLGIMDYYKLRNVQADTDMRRSIAGAPPRRWRK